jgi:hypothetical protein
MERYRVYVGAIQNLTQKTQYSFCDPTASRMLVFSSRKPDGDFRVMRKYEQETLNKRESTWLSQVRFCVAMENTSRSAQEAAKNINCLLDALEKELQREKEAMPYGEHEEQTEQTE